VIVKKGEYLIVIVLILTKITFDPRWGKFNYSVWWIKNIFTSLPRTELSQAGMMAVEVGIRTSPGRNIELRRSIITK
jgi:hypothetical protein